MAPGALKSFGRRQEWRPARACNSAIRGSLGHRLADQRGESSENGAGRTQRTGRANVARKTGKPLKTLKTAMGGDWKKLARIWGWATSAWVWRRVRFEFALGLLGGRAARI